MSFMDLLLLASNGKADDSLYLSGLFYSVRE